MKTKPMKGAAPSMEATGLDSTDTLTSCGLMLSAREKEVSLMVEGMELVPQGDEEAPVGATDSLSPGKFSIFNVRTNRKIYNELMSQRERDALYIQALEEVLRENNISLPPPVTEYSFRGNKSHSSQQLETPTLDKDGSVTSIQTTINRIKQHHMSDEISIQFRNLTFWGMVPERTIPTVGSTLRNMLFGSGPKHRVDILHDLTGRIPSGKMTLVMGPPGCGKSSFLKVLAGQLYVGRKKLEGSILYNGEPPDSGKYLLPKIADYIDEKDQHAAALTVQETLEFAWLVTTNGHHSYGVAKDEEGAEYLNRDDKIKGKVNSVIRALGLEGCRNTVVGDGMLRGVSGGQKRRVTVGEMLLPPRRIKFMDAVSNGLDSSTTYDIFKSIRLVTDVIGVTPVVSLLQPTPEVFDMFDELILLSEGRIIYHGPRSYVLQYFESIGYHCPDNVDVADFLQELPTLEGRRFIDNSKEDVPRGTAALVNTFKRSELFSVMLKQMDTELEESKNYKWPEFVREPYATTTWDAMKLCLERQTKLTMRDKDFVVGRLMQAVVIGAIAGSLFNDTEEEDVQTLGGVLFFGVLFCALSSMSLLPVIFDQRQVYYKHARANFFPTSSFVVAQTAVLYPIQIAEVIIFSTIIYWSVGMSDSDSGTRFLTFLLIIFAFALTATQLFRLVASFMPDPVTAQPVSGVSTVLMVLFSGYIVPKSNIPPGWEWFYWLNPLSWALQSVTINEYLSSDYDFEICTNADCSKMERFGDVALEGRGNQTEQAFVWYGLIVLIGEYVILLILTYITLTYLRVEPVPPPPLIIDEEPSDEAEISEANAIEIPFEPVTFSFKDIWYTVTLKGGEELDLLKGVSGYFEPGTLTALMGSSGAGKTTLLDVLSGRKNTGSIQGQMYVNGKPKEENTFRHIMGYVEQFDTLSPHDTAREAVEFSAALRLPRGTTASARKEWVTHVLSMLELTPLERTLVGEANAGGMSFEQRKRLSIAVELAANPSILFLDEPTSGLDSRSAQVVIRCIRRVAASGRSIVCTIHQPSISIFKSFDSLLLLRRGGQTVFSGPLGEDCEYLINFFEAIPGVQPIKPRQNPASWMLDVIGAGTGNSESITDFHVYYKQSTLCSMNTRKVNVLCTEDNADEEENNADNHACRFVPVFVCNASKTSREDGHYNYNASYVMQFRYLMYRELLAYWRSPTYNFVRMDQKYDTDVDVISRCAVIFITLLFTGVVGMMSVQPVVFAERPAFYREQHSKVYDVSLYSLVTGLVEIPYLLVSSLIFVIPFFFIVGFDNEDVSEKFFWYWLFQGLYMSTLVFLGQFFSVLLPNEATSQVLSGMSSTLLSLFGGFMIRAKDIPDFWIFLYWLNPLHYALEGLFTTQFHEDESEITLLNGQPTTAGEFVESYYSTWMYSHRIGDFVALMIFIIVLRIATYLALKYLRHDKR